jgi:hypothetical protein
MKKATIIFGLISSSLLAPGANAAAGDSAALKIDFSQNGGAVQAGYEAYFASHEAPATFTPQSYSAFGTRVTVTPSWAAGATAAAMQMIDRGGDDGTDTPNLLRDWIGTDNRQPGNPMTLTISGLPAGAYSWLSYHHDPEDQTGLFNVTVNDAAGSATTTDIDITDGRNSGVVNLADVTTFTTEIVSDGTDITVVFDVTSGTSPVSVAFFVMNALVLEAQNPCYNSPPTIRGPNALSVFIGEPVVIDVTVADDGMPYIEGCNPDQPKTGTPYGLQYKWLQQSGPAPVAIEPISADVEDPNLVFPLVGTYELVLQVSDGPVGSGPEDGKIAEFLITVEALEPLKGDIDRNEIVDFLDLWMLADQWLDMPACLEDTYCADLDNRGGVTFKDFALLSSNWLTKTTRVVINEFVASNSRSLVDGDGNFSDWIELHNPDTQPVSLGGWYLTDDRDNLKKWRFPQAAVLPAGGYLVVFASDQPTDNYIDKKGNLHTNFAIDKEGEYLALVSPGGAIMHQFAPYFPPQEADVSYGMWYTMFRYFAVPTPGQANKEAFLGYTARTSHSHSRGFYDEPFSVRIFCDTPGALIRYTLDGSEPAEQYGMIYDPNTPIPITTTTHVRSVAFKPGWRLGRVTTHTYIFVDDVAWQPANPLGWPSDWGYDSDLDNNDGVRNGIVTADYEMDPRVGNSTLPEYSIRDALLDIPTVSVSMHPDDFISDATGIYANPLSRWERKCSIEYILPDGAEGFQHDCKIEIHGNASRRPYRMQKHSLRLTFTSLYGPAKLNYPLFPESSVEEFNQLVLRGSFTDSWGLVSWTESRYRPNDSQYIRDVWMKESLRDMGQPSTYGKFVQLYVNGLYFGLYNLTERFADEFLADHLGGQAEDWEINEDFSTPGSRWRAMMSIDPATLDGYAQMMNYLDVENFADYMLLHFYADAEDWPHHNGYAAANAISGDGRFRFFVWDQEIVLDYHGRAATRIDSTGGAGDVFQKMRTSAEFRLLFADRVHKHCFNDGALNQSTSAARYLGIANWIDKAVVAESARWGDTQMSTPYGNTIRQPSPLTDINHNLYPPAPHGPDFYFTREDSWLVERDNVINNYIPAIHNPANSYALINVLRAENLYPDTDASVFRINGTYQHGGHISTGDALTMTNPNGTGTIYYTLDGSDPRVPASSQSDFTNVLVPESAGKRVFVPTADIGDDWTGGSEPYDDSAWNQGIFIANKSGGIGYERGSGYQNWISYDVGSTMYNTGATSVYIRVPFTVAQADLTDVDFLKLNVRYDDGFVAYINGHEVQRSPAVSGPVAWNSTAGSHEAAGLETFDITKHTDKLTVGDNILALHGLNAATSSTDFIISAEMVTGKNSPAGGISETALTYLSPIVLGKSTHVKSRVLNGSEWSALNETVFAVGPVAENLRITEIMYHPQDTNNPDDPNTEFIELKNIAAVPININLVRFTNGIDFTFPGIELGPDEYVLVVKDIDAFEAKYGAGLNVAGQYTGNLRNDGERVELQDAAGTTIHNFRYQDGWYDITDGLGFSLTVKDPANADPNNWGGKSVWRPSAALGGSPGTDDTGQIPELGDVVINELLAHSHGEASDWIELHNTTDHTVNIGGWFLSDDESDLKKYEIPGGTFISPGGYIVFTEGLHFGNRSDPGCHVPFALSENGETLYLHSGQDGDLTGYSEQESFDASQTDVAFGRYQKSTGSYNFVAMSVNTPGSANAYPKVGPIVISEIMYHPDSPADAEYVELLNISDTEVTLYDYATAQPWRFTDDPDDPGIEYLFTSAPPVTVAPGEHILLVKDLAIFNSRYAAPGETQIFVWGAGRLDNGGEKVQISMPGDVNSEGVRQYIRVDRISYSDGSHHDDFTGGVDPWPIGADGLGSSLNRLFPQHYGNDPDNWTAAPPSPGE